MKDKLLLQIVYASIKEEFNPKIYIKKEFLLKEYSFLNEVQATFITLKINNVLRGCIGSLQAHRILLEDLIHNAKAAAFKDPRFKPLSINEFKNIQIEVSLLSKAKFLEYSDLQDLKSKVKVFTHGIILSHENKRSTFLPQVWEQLNNFEIFFDALCKKAGLDYSCLSKGALIYTYEVKKIK